MARTIKCGLIQAANAAPTDAPIEEIKRANIEKHVKMIEDAAKQGVQILCMQEVFTTPYFCAEQQTRWYEAVEKVPDGPTVKLMQEVAKQHGMVIIVPIYEEELLRICHAHEHPRLWIRGSGRVQHFRPQLHSAVQCSLCHLSNSNQCLGR